MTVDVPTRTPWLREYLIHGHHSRFHVVADMAVIHPGADIVRDHVRGNHLRRGQEYHVGPRTVHAYDIPVPVRGMEVETIAQANQVPAHVVAFVHGHHGHIAVKIAVDSHANI